jgi:hypothetical protein
MADVFSGFEDLFTVNSLSQSIIELPYVPTTIAKSNIFVPESITTTTVILESDGLTIGLVEASPRGSQGQVVGEQNNRKATPFVVPHLAEYGSILADSVQGIRKFGSTTETKSVQEAINKKLAIMRRQLDYTIESYMLDAIRGFYRDVNGTAISLFTLFGKKQKTIAIDFTSATTKPRVEFLKVTVAIEEALGDTISTGTIIYYGKKKWEEFIGNSEVEKLYINYEAASQLRGDARKPFWFGDVWHERYRGSGLVKIDDDEAYAVPQGVPEMFKLFQAPADYVETVNQLGQAFYAKAEPMKFNKGFELEGQGNQIALNAIPHAVIKIN